MAAEDDALRAQLDAAGDEYVRAGSADPQLVALRRKHNSRLSQIIDEVGWPGLATAGPDGSDAAWRLAMFALDEPALQARCLQAMEDVVEEGDVLAWQPAFLLDRLLMQEGKEQVYGSQLVTSSGGDMFAPWPMQEPDTVDQRRSAIGAGTLADALRAAHDAARA